MLRLRELDYADLPMETARLDELTALLPPGRVTTEPVELELHAADFWPRLVMARRRGETLAPPAAVVRPAATAEVATVLRWCHERDVAVVPFGGGTGVCGGAAAVADAITLDLQGLDAVVDLDHVSGTVTVQPGIVAQALEDFLAHRGWTLGHFPASIHGATVGGLLAVRSAGQASSGYGKLEDLVVGLEAVLADGTVFEAKPVPASAAGPDLKRLFLGGEGTTGVITQATLSLHPKPETTLDRGFLFSDLEAGLDAIRQLLRAGVTPTVVRLYDETDTAMTFGGHKLELPRGCLTIVAAEGSERVARFVADAARQLLTQAGGRDLGPGPGEYWRSQRYDASYQFASYMRPDGVFGNAVMLDTMEVAALWSRLPGLYERVRAALSAHADVVLAHVSHVYPEGACIYFTFGAAPGQEALALARYDAAWEAGQRAALAAGGTISHHHGVGLLRVPWVAEELGTGGLEVLRRVKAALDPAGGLNPGKLLGVDSGNGRHGSRPLSAEVTGQSGR